MFTGETLVIIDKNISKTVLCIDDNEESITISMDITSRFGPTTIICFYQKDIMDIRKNNREKYILFDGNIENLPNEIEKRYISLYIPAKFIKNYYDHCSQYIQKLEYEINMFNDSWGILLTGKKEYKKNMSKQFFRQKILNDDGLINYFTTFI